MAKPEALLRVEADLEHGRVRSAIQRLGGLISAYPQDLELRARLADACRRAGDVPEAGRWGFLTEDAEPHEIAAFTRKNRSATDRLRLLHLHGEEPRGLGPLAQPRYAELAADAARTDVRPPKDDALPPVPRTASRPAAPAPPLGWSLVDLLTALAVFGPVTVVVCVVIYELVAAVFASPHP
ncbi:hypothetical protein Aph02nite_31910 [Actinoplanes philippinensis]|uniref:DUF6584 family protein n=1 Tax=Actinoplanes philippinensis TaxID=35752 RepID=UPI000B82AE50|nr:DUF6584 family protein [Actinoplanes philippinensis]GIE77241.1 hypothetical protein Aph02nite_31910 [Actinoplanes philippinensis]